MRGRLKFRIALSATKLDVIQAKISRTAEGTSYDEKK